MRIFSGSHHWRKLDLWELRRGPSLWRLPALKFPPRGYAWPPPVFILESFKNVLIGCCWSGFFEICIFFYNVFLLFYNCLYILLYLLYIVGIHLGQGFIPRKTKEINKKLFSMSPRERMVNATNFISWCRTSCCIPGCSAKHSKHYVLRKRYCRKAEGGSWWKNLILGSHPVLGSH